MPLVCSTTTTTCGACRRTYRSPRQLKLHRRRVPLCAEWLGMPPGSRDGRCAALRTCSSPAEDAVKPLAIAPEAPTAAADGRPASFAADGGVPAGCQAAFEWSSIAGGAFAPFAPFAQRVGSDADLWEGVFDGHAPHHAPAYSLCHIIWNVFLIDKEFVRLPNFDAIVAENRVSCVIAILPDATLYDGLVGDRMPPGTDHGVIEYAGHDVEQPLDTAAYDAQCARIEAHRLRRGNVFVFCNNGYQRSLPFLAYYLTRFHADEVPSVERAIDIILPQVDKASYATRRDGVVRECEVVLRSSTR